MWGPAHFAVGLKISDEIRVVNKVIKNIHLTSLKNATFHTNKNNYVIQKKLFDF